METVESATQNLLARLYYLGPRLTDQHKYRILFPALDHFSFQFTLFTAYLQLHNSSPLSDQLPFPFFLPAHIPYHYHRSLVLTAI